MWLASTEIIGMRFSAGLIIIIAGYVVILNNTTRQFKPILSDNPTLIISTVICTHFLKIRQQDNGKILREDI